MIEATIEAKVNTAMDRIREDNHQYHRDATIRGWIKYRIWSIVAAGLFVLIDLYGPDKVEEWTQKYVNEKMNQPMIERAADKIMHDRMAGYHTCPLKRLPSHYQERLFYSWLLCVQWTGVSSLVVDPTRMADGASGDLARCG